MEPVIQDERTTIYCGERTEVLRGLPDESVHCCVTSPPYFGLRDYGHEGQIGLESTPAEYVARLVEVFREVRRVLRADGTAWVNLGDSYAGSWGSQGRQGNTGQMAGRSVANVREKSKLQAARIEANAYPSKVTRTGAIPDGSGLKPKDLIGIPWRVAFALQADGWWLRQDIIWAKPNPMPESVTDRCTKAHEYVFLLSKSERYYFDQEAIREPHSEMRDYPTWEQRKLEGAAIRRGDPGISGDVCKWTGVGGHPNGRNKRSVWTVSTKPYSGAHFATFPPDLIEPCIMAGCPEGGTVLDPFLGSGTTAKVANEYRRKAIGIEINPNYLDLVRERISRNQIMLIA